jgi:hopanoid biosynthesis associated protein HpnK
MAAKRRLIINADDFGLTSSVNRAIEESHQRGVVTSATLMANSAGFAEAVTVAKRNPQLGVGCHITLLDCEPTVAAGQIPSLCPDGKLRQHLGPFALAAICGRIRAREVAAEADAQLAKISASGIAPTHFDTHKHTHLFPVIFKPLLEVARAHGIRAVRNPFVPLKPLAFAHLARRPRLWTRYSETKILRSFKQGFLNSVRSHGMVTTDGSFGIVTTGTLDERLFASIIGCIPEGTWELVCHPGYNDADLSLVRTRLRQSRATELAILTSNQAKQTLERYGIELISYRELDGCA